MTTTDAITLLRTYNKWRRGDESIEQPHPTEIGVAIDTVLNSLENAQQDHAKDDVKNMGAVTISKNGYIENLERQANDALLQLGAIQSLITEVFDLDRTPTTTDEIRAVLERNAANGIHSCHPNCQRTACVLRRERDTESALADELADAVKALRQVLATMNATGNMGMTALTKHAVARRDKVLGDKFPRKPNSTPT